VLCYFLTMTVDRLIETGDSEHIFQKTIMEQVRGQVLAKIQKRWKSLKAGRKLTLSTYVKGPIEVAETDKDNVRSEL
ncbi:hypothetical protein HID58_033014, partial [Brassica napus]